jgi:hypothetical protein
VIEEGKPDVTNDNEGEGEDRKQPAKKQKRQIFYTGTPKDNIIGIDWTGWTQEIFIRQVCRSIWCLQMVLLTTNSLDRKKDWKDG